MGVIKFRNLNTGQATPVPTGEYTIGREDSTYVHVEDASVSRQHAKIINLEEGCYLEDLGSVNGTAARGALIKGRAKIDIGEVVYIGSVPFRVDPEVGGTAVAKEPDVAARPASKAYMRRHTERIALPPVGAAASGAMASLSLDRTTVPVPNPAVNPVAISPGITVLPGAPSTEGIPAEEVIDPARLPVIRPGVRPEPKELPVQSFIAEQATPTPAEIAQRAAEQRKAAFDPFPPTPSGAAPVFAPAPKSPESAGGEGQVEPVSGWNWQWLAISFVAGIGVGLLLGLYFAKMFIDMGGKPAGLP